MKRSTDRILTTHAGSLPMPSDLSEMLRTKEAGQPYDALALQQRLTRAVAAVVQQQVENGIDIITDGEQSKTSFTTYLSERLAGIETRPGVVARAVSDRRRIHLMRKRAELLAHIQHTNSQYNLPELGKKIAYKANRAGVAERFPAPAIQKRLEVDLALIGHDDQLLRDVELSIGNTAKHHNAHTLSLLRTVPGLGEIL